MTNQEIYEKILNKKFQKSVFTGYETKDVDQFFDYVIEYLKGNEKDVASYKKTADNLKEDNDKLRQQLQACKIEIDNLMKQVKQYKDDGYENVSNNKKKQEEINKKGAK